MREHSLTKTAGLFLACLLAASLLCAPAQAAGMVTSTGADGTGFGAYRCLEVTGLTPYVFAPAGAGAVDSADYTNVTAMAERYGEELGIVAAVSGGLSYSTRTRYGFCFRDPDGPLIADGVVLRSTESIDHSECDILVIAEDGSVGWADYWADADALAAGTGFWYDVNGETVTGKRIVSAMTGFVPIVVGGRNVYDPLDDRLFGYDNFVGHYSSGAVRQIFGVRENGTYVVLTGLSDWTLAQAAEAALHVGCVFAFNLDGGGSAETVIAYDAGEGYEVRTVRGQMRGERGMPTFLVFTAINEAPVSAVPAYITAEGPESLPAGVGLADIAAALTVTETLENADGGTSVRRLYSAQSREEAPLLHTVVGPEEDRVRSESLSPAGTLFYVKNDEETAWCLSFHGNTRLDGAYYDYSTGFTVTTADDLTTPGEKTAVVTYVPGYGLDALTDTVEITLR